MKVFIFVFVIVFTFNKVTSLREGIWKKVHEGGKIPDHAIRSGGAIGGRWLYICRTSVRGMNKRSGYVTIDLRGRSGKCQVPFQNRVILNDHYDVLLPRQGENPDVNNVYEWRGYNGQEDGNRLRDKVLVSERVNDHWRQFVCRVTLDNIFIPGTYDPKTGICSVVYGGRVVNYGGVPLVPPPEVMGCQIGCFPREDYSEDG